MKRSPSLLVAVLATLAACGGPEGEPAPRPEGAPPHATQWVLVDADEVLDGTVIQVVIGEPCEVALVVEEPDGAETPHAVRQLSAGAIVRVAWQGDASRAERAVGVRAPPEDAAAGRTEPYAVDIRFGFRNGARHRVAPVAWARPGTARAHVYVPPPPAREESLAVPGEIELIALAVTDAEGDVALRPREGRAAWTGPGARGVRVWRLLLRIAPR